MYVGKPENPKDVQIFKEEMNQFLGAFVDPERSAEVSHLRS
jgi:hypothetical protein